MKSFRYPLQAVLTLREEKEEAAQRLVVLAQNAVVAAELALAALARQLDALGDELRTRLSAGLPAQTLAQFGDYRVALTERRTVLQREWTTAQERLAEARAGLIRATQDRQALEKHRERLHRAHAQQTARSEQNLLDDLAGRTSLSGSRWTLTPSAPAP